MKPQEYYNTYIVYARESEAVTKVPALFTLAQSALETGYGKATAGRNNFFGIKDTDGVNGNEQLVLTTEYNSQKGIWIKIRQYFRSYKTPADSFTDHGKFLRSNTRYRMAFNYTDPYRFAQEVAKAGYATDPRYYEKLKNIMNLLTPKSTAKK